MNRILLALRCFFSILFRGRISEEAAQALGLAPAPAEEPPTEAPTPEAPAEDRFTEGALQMLAILQRDARLLDFVMEDISGYPDEQIGAAIRTLHADCAKSLTRYVHLGPVIDGVEGDVTRLEEHEAAKDPSAVKFLGNVPAQGRPQQGVLRHRGWKAQKTEVPAPAGDPAILAPAEVEVE